MQKRRTVKLIGTIYTREPLTVTLKDTQNGPKHQMPRNNGNAYFPSSSIRGCLRHAGFNLINERRNVSGEEKFSLNQMFMLSQGYFVDQDEEELATKQKSGIDVKVDVGLDVRKVNPFMSLFGRWGLTGKLSIGNAYTSNEHECQFFGAGARGIVFERNEELLNDLSENDVAEYKDILKLQAEVVIKTKEIDDNIRDLKKKALLYKDDKGSDKREKIFKEIKVLEDEKKRLKKDKGKATESIRRPIDGMEAICSNVHLEHKMQIEGATEIEFGMFLATLGSFSRNARLGAKAAQNYGLVSANWEVKVWDDETFGLTTIGRVAVDDNGLTLEGDEVKSALKTWQNAEGLDYTKYI